MKTKLTLRVFTGFLAAVMLFGMVPVDTYATTADDVYVDEAVSDLDIAEITQLVESSDPTESPEETEEEPEPVPETTQAQEPETIPETTQAETVPEETEKETEPATVETVVVTSPAMKAGTADAATAADLEAALTAGADSIRITASFEIDRTFYITKDTVIYTESAQTLTRAADFAGDIFVVGEAADGTVCADAVKLTLGKKDSEEKDLLIIDGNKDNMTEGVVVSGSVIFLSGKGQADLYDNLTVQSAKKSANARTLEVENPGRVGGAVAIVTKDAQLNVFGGTYKNNTVDDEETVTGTDEEVEAGFASTLGGVIYAQGKVNVEGGLFKENHAANGGAIYAKGAELTVKNAEFTSNSASVYGGAIYADATAVAMEEVTFASNTSVSYGGAVYAIGVTDAEQFDVNVKDTTFTSNSATASVGAVYLGGGIRSFMTNVVFAENKSSGSKNCGALLATDAGTYLEIDGGTFRKNTAYNGGAMGVYDSALVVANNLTIEQNESSSKGGFCYVSGGELDMYNSTATGNTSGDHGSVVCVYTASGGTAKLYKCHFEGNESQNYGAVVLYSNSKKHIIQDCTFKNNKAKSYGGAIFIAGQGGLGLYNTTGIGNSASHGGFMYITKASTEATVAGLTVSGNTDANGGPVIWGNTLNAKLYIDKSKYTDLEHTGEYDDAYWNTATNLKVNKLNMIEASITIPDYLDYGEEEPDVDLSTVYDVDSAEKLAAALNAGRENIRITKSFNIDRTFYVTKSVKIFSEAAVTLKRDPAFGGDIFVIGESEAGVPCGETAVLTLGDPASKTADLLTIDGNKDNMIADVVGSVIFVTGRGQADLHENLTIQNAKKLGNARTSDADHGVSYPDRIGGAVAILAAKSQMNIYGGSYKNNAVSNEDSASFQGGAIYNFGTLNIYGGLFEGNEAERGGAIYNYRTLNLYKAEIKNNIAAGPGGAIYAAASTACFTNVGGENEVVESSVLFSGNQSKGNGGAILAQMTVNIADATFDGNTTVGKGGAIYIGAGECQLTDSTFKNNTATENGGALYVSKNKLIAKNNTFTGNSAVSGGAVYLTGQTDEVELDVKFTGSKFDTNTATADGGAIAMAGGVRVSVVDTDFSGNSAAVSGGAICAAKSILTLSGGSFTGNSAAKGGAVHAEENGLTVTGAEFKNNTATENGGALYLDALTAEIIGSEFADNTAASGGAICLAKLVAASMNEIVATGNKAENGGFLMAEDSSLLLYNGTIKENSATANGGAIAATAKGSVKVYETAFEGNTAANGGAVDIASDSTDNLLQACSFVNNTASANGGAVRVSAGGAAAMYTTTATGNKAENGAIVYLADEKTNVKLGGLTVSGNTATSGTVAAGDAGAVLDIDKSQYTDSDATGTLNKAYWAAAITGKLKVNDVKLEIPRYNEYGNEDAGEELQDAMDVKSADELEAALKAGASEIRITESFQVDRTFYVTSSTTIFSTAKITLQRAPDFAGDIFVVGTREDLEKGTEEAPYEPITLKLGNPGSKTAGLLTIDGNKDNMTVDVVGTALLLYGPNHADLYENLTIKNAHKVDNERLQDAVDKDVIISYPKRVGGSAIIITKNSTMNIYGGDYINNSVRDETGDSNDELASTQGVIYNYGTMRIYGGRFIGNHASRGGVFYNYRTMYIYNAEVKNNSSYSLGGVMYVPNSTACKTYIGLENDVVEPHVVFSGNSAGNTGGVLYAQKVVEIHNTVFENNTTTKHGGALAAYSGTFNLSNVVFKDNKSEGAGAAIYASKTSLNIENAEFTGNHAETYGGAVYQTGQGTSAIDLELHGVKFEKNIADSYGGAVVLASGARSHAVQTDFVQNTAKSADKGGGAVYLAGSSLSMNIGSFTGNTGTYGGAIYSTEGTLKLISTDFAENTATADGGAIYQTGTTITVVEGKEDEAGWDADLKNCTFSKNTAAGSGGGIYMDGGARVKMKAMTFTENQAKSTSLGGAAIYAAAATLDLNGGTLTGNKATNYGGAMYFAADSTAVMNKLTAEQNNAAKYGGVIYTVGSVSVYNSTFKNNSTNSSHGAAIYANTNGVIQVYNSLFESNSSGNNGGAIGIYTKTKGNLIHTCTFTNNTAKGFGGAIFLSNASGLELYRTIATGNSADKGGFMYETTSGSDVTIGELTVSGNTATTGGPIIWGNTKNAKLHIDPATYVDLDHTGEYDDAYWAAAIYNLLTYDFVTVEVPYYLDYASVDPGADMRDAVEVTSAEELEAALKGDNNKIRIAEDFEIDRTFYITKEVYIFAAAPHVLTRAADFAGDIFVVGEDASGKSALLYGGQAHLHMGLPGNEKKDLLVIDGNRDLMDVTVTGSVIFMSSGSRVDLYEGLTIQNCKKTGNVRILNKNKYGLNNAFRLAGTVVLNVGGSLNIHGGKYINNASAKVDAEKNPDKTSTIGGIIYTYGALNMDGGLFQNNEGGQGGVIYATHITRITGGKFIGNAGSSTGGVICLAGYSSTHLILGKAGEGEAVLFEGNSSASNGTCIYASGKGSVTILGNTVFKDNTTKGNGTVNVYSQMTVRDTKFINNTTGNRGGAIYVSTAYDPATMPTRHVVIENCTFTGNKANLGGAIQMYSGSENFANGSKVTVTNCTFENNTANYYGGAVHLDLKSQLTMSDCVLTGNTATREGGAIYASNVSRVNVSNSKFVKNTAKQATAGGGGAICTSKSFLTVENSEFTENTAAYRGGAIHALNTNTSEVVTVKDSIFTGNTAAEAGGAVYLDNIGAYMRRVNFLNNKVTATTGYGGAIIVDGSILELDTAEMSGNSAANSGGAISAFGSSDVTLNAITATGNNTSGVGGFLYARSTTAKIYDSKLEANTASKTGGAMHMDAGTVGRVYNTQLLSNTAASGGAVYAVVSGKNVLMHSCELTGNKATDNGGALYAGTKTTLYLYNTNATTNSANKGGVLYLTDSGSAAEILKLNVSGNTAAEAGPVVYGNSQNVLKINKALYTDADVTTELDDAYWAAALAGSLKVSNVTTKVPGYTAYKSRSEDGSSGSLKPIKSEDVAPIFKLAKKSSDANINSVYNGLKKLKNKSNFQSRSTVKFPNINGQTVTVDTFVYPDHGTANNCTVGEGLLIYQAMCYKKAHPEEEVYIDIASYRFSVQAAVNINRNSRYFGYMRQLEDVEYDKYGFVRVAYLLVAAAKMGIHVNVVGHLDGYPMSKGEPGLKKYFTDRLRHTCDPAYVKNGGVVGDYMNFTFVEWSLKNRGGTDMMHNKMCAVSHYLDKDGKVHRNAVFSSSSNLDGIRPDACNANWKLQTATIISDHAELYNTAINYMRLTQEYAPYLDGIMEFQHVVNERTTKQIDLILAGKANEIPKNEQLVYIGTENDDVFELYFTPFGGDANMWEEKYNPYCKYTRKLHDSEGYITFGWSAAEYSRHTISNQIEDMVSDAFHTNRNLKNKLYIYAENYDASVYKDLEVGEDIGYLSINKKVHGTVHNKDLQFSYVEDGTRYYVSLLNSLNVHGGTMSYQPNFALVIKETGICSKSSVYATVEKYSMGGTHIYHDYGEKQVHMPESGHGYYYQECRSCGEIKKLGTAHISGQWIIDRRATPTQNGIRHKECTVCGKITESGEIVYDEPLTVDLSALTGRTFTSGSTSAINLSLSGTPRTFEALVQVPTSITGSAGVIVGNYSGSKSNQISLEISAEGRPYLYIKNSKKAASVRFETDIRSDEPVHLTVTADGTAVQLFVNGELKETATLTRSYPTTSSSFKIGGDNRKSNKAYFRGRIYSVSLFSNVRTEEEVKRDVVFVPNDAGSLLYTGHFTQEVTGTDLTGKTFGSSAPVAIEENLTSVPRTLEATIQVPKDMNERVGTIVGNYDGGKSAQMNLEIYEGGRVRLYTKSSKYTNSCIFKTDIRSDEPTHIAVTVSGKTAKLYVNGQYAESGKLSRSIPSAVAGFKVGCDNNNRYFDATIYNVNLFSDVRTAEEILADAVAVAADAQSLLYSCDFAAEGGKTFGQTDDYGIQTLSAAPHTIEAVVQVAADYNDYVGVITGNWNDSDAPQLNLEVQAGGKLNLRWYSNGNLASHQFQTDIRSAALTHVAVSVEGTTANLYVNGILKETATLSAELPAATDGFRIGGDNTTDKRQYFNGKIYSVKMFSDARTAEEVAKDLYYLPAGTDGLIYCGVFAEDLTSLYPEARTFSAANVYSVPSMPKTPKTIEAVVQVPKDMDEYVGVITGNYSGSKNQMMLDVQAGGKVRLYFKTSKTTVSQVFKTDIRSDEPVHVAVTVSGKTARLYLNGVYMEKAKLKASMPTARVNFRIGGDARVGNSAYFKGKIYSLTMFSDARSAAEIYGDMALVPSNAPSLMFTKTFSSSDRSITVCTGGMHVSSDWIVDVPATETENGIKHTACTVCGRRLQVSEIIRTKIVEEEMDFTDVKAGLFFTSEHDTYRVEEKLATKTTTIEVNLQLPKGQSSRAGTVLGNYNGGSSDQFNLEIYTKGRPKLWYKKNGKKYTCQFKTDVRSSDMVNLTLTISGKTAKLYLNGKLKETKKLSATVPNVTSNFRVGGDRRDGNSNYFKGTIYSVNVFNDVRTKSEIGMDKIYVPADTGNLIYSVYFKAPAEGTPT